MESSGFDDQMFNEFSPGPLSPLGPKAIQHHSHHHHYNMPQHHQTIMIGGSNDLIQQQRLPDVHNILPGGSPKMEHYKPLDYGSSNNSKIEYNIKLDSSPYSPTKIEYLNGSGKLEQYSPNSGKQLEYTTVTSNGQYSPNAKIIEYTSSGGSNKMEYEHIQMFQQPQPMENNQQQQTLLVNGLNNNNNNFKRKSEESLNSGSSTPTTTTVTSVSPTDNSSSNNANKKSNDKKKTDPNGIKKKKTRYFKFY
jgi:hypothetical protein